MPFVIVVLDGQDGEILLNLDHVVKAERVMPPFTRVTLSNGDKHVIALPLVDLQLMDPV